MRSSMKHATAVALAVVFCGLSSSSRVLSAQQPAAQGGDAIAPEALAQIAALLADKQARTPIQQKIDSQLLYEEKMEGGQPVADGRWVVDTDLPYAGDGHIVVDVRA